MQSRIEPPVVESPHRQLDLFPQANGIAPADSEPPDGGSPASSWMSSRPAVLVFSAMCLAILVAVAVVYLASMTNNLSVEGDNAIYMILAKAMSAGHGYTNIQGPTPRIEAQYPPLFPIMLVPVVWAFGVGGVLQMQALVTSFALASFVLGFFLFRRWTGSALLGLGVVLATAESDLVWSFSHKVLTEIPYLFLTLLTCLLVSRYNVQQRWRTWTGFLVVLAAGAVFLARTVGVSVCAAVPIYLLLAPPLRGKHDWHLRVLKAAATCAGIMIVAGGWTLRNRIVYSGEGHSYLSQFMLKQTYVPDAGSVTSNELLNRVGDNASYYADQFQRILVGQFWDRVSTAPEVAHTLLAITVVGFVFALWKRRTVAEFYMAAYVLIVLFWPWQDLRFAVPVMPFLFYYVAMAVFAAFSGARRLRTVGPGLLTGLVLIPLTLPTGIHTVHVARDDRVSGYHYQADKLGEWIAYADWQDFHAAALWLRSHAAPGSTVINRSPNIFYLWTGLASRNYPYSYDRWSVMQDVSHEQVDYVLLDDFSWTYTTNLYMRPVIQRYPDRFVLLRRFRGAAVYEVVHLAPAGG